MSTTMKQLGDRLRARRRELDMTIAEVAESAELSLPYVSNLERGRGNPTLDALQAITNALQTTLSELLDDEVTEETVQQLALASIPGSLQRYARTERFKATVDRLAELEDEDPAEMRRRVLIGMANAPRRASGEPTEDDWRRLLDTYRLMLEAEQ